MPPRRIGLLGFDDLQAVDLFGPADVFRSDALDTPDFRDGDAPRYEVVVIGVTGRRFTASNGVEITARYTIPTSVALDTLIVPGGRGLRRPGVANRIAAWISACAPRVRRIASVCSGIYGLAPTGLLDDRAVATHCASPRDARAFKQSRVRSATRATMHSAGRSSDGSACRRGTIDAGSIS